MTSVTPLSPDAADALRHTLLEQAARLDGELRVDPLHRALYAQDASIYQEEPLGVVFPRHRDDLRAIVRMAHALRMPIIPRAAGTSLAGQCVGQGLVVDVGRHMNQILEINAAQRWVRVQPGVILDDLNRALKPHGLFFAPDTSTSNRCMIGGMIGNNSCGTHSILYGTTRDHVLSMEVLFADGAEATLSAWSEQEFGEQLARQDALGRGLRFLDQTLREHAALIRARYPRPEVQRRNTGYALDELLQARPYGGSQPLQLSRLLCGSEGTLALTVEATLRLVELPKQRLVLCAHFASLEESLRATVLAVGHQPAAVELIDKRILDLAKDNIEQARHRHFLVGDPEAILAIELFGDDLEALRQRAQALADALQAAQLGYAYPVIPSPGDKSIWEVRKAGLGILMGVPGDVKPVTLVEDTAVAVDVLPDYIRDFAALMDKHQTQCVYYAHASVGELHLRPELNIKEPGDVQKFLAIAHEVTDLVKKYGGSVSGEHGDGRLRSPMLEQFYGAEVAALHVGLKRAFDPEGLLNPGKIVDAKPIDADWRHEPGQPTPELPTHFDWSADMGLVRALEKCNGAGACRKRAEAGGTMCPSYMATLDEKDSTRGRANVFRNLVRDNEDPRQAMASPQLYEAMELCLSCKGCKSECPANVDMGRMKAEFLQHYHDAHGAPLSAYVFGRYGRLSRLGALLPALTNLVLGLALTKWLMLKLLGVSPKRALPAYAKRRATPSLKAWLRRQAAHASGWAQRPLIWIYIDPFTEYTEPELVLAAAKVLAAAGWRVEVLPVVDDGRTQISKGLLREAKALGDANMATLEPLLKAHPEAKIVGLEPSALLTFRDETLDLVSAPWRATARAVASRCLLLDELITHADTRARFDDVFAPAPHPAPQVILHGHCHQKALVGLTPTVKALELAGYKVTPLSTGCCGMAGSFGYEDRHYELSMQIAELTLMPAVRAASPQTLIAAPGTSCRHQIKDGAQREALHPVILLERALRARADLSA